MTTCSNSNIGYNFPYITLRWNAITLCYSSPLTHKRSRVIVFLSHSSSHTIYSPSPLPPPWTRLHSLPPFLINLLILCSVTDGIRRWGVRGCFGVLSGHVCVFVRSRRADLTGWSGARTWLALVTADARRHSLHSQISLYLHIRLKGSPRSLKPLAVFINKLSFRP